MNIKNSFKISIVLDSTLKFLNNMVLYLFKFTVIFMVLSPILLFINLNFTTLTTVFELYIKILLLIPLLATLSAVVVCTNNIFNKTKKYLKTTYNKQLILYCLFNKPHHSSKLNLELQKISKAVENKSSLYQELNETDFPYLNKLFKRFEKSKKCSIINENMSTVQKDLSKLNLHHCDNPKLLTMNHVDEELNNLINNQFANLNSQKDIDCVKMKRS